MLQATAPIQLYGQQVAPRLDLGVADLLAHGLVALKGIRRSRQPVPVAPNRAEVTVSRQRVIIQPGALNFLRRTAEVIVAASSGTDLLFIAFPARTVLRTVGVQSRRYRSYLRLEAYGEMTAALVPGEHALEYGFWYSFPALRIPGALAAPQPLDRLFTGLIWDPTGASPSTSPATVDWRPARAAEIAAHSTGTVAYVGDQEPLVATMESPWRPNRCSFSMAEHRPSGIRLHPDVDAELGCPPGFALCVEKDWPTVYGPSDLILVASANSAVAYGVDRSCTRAPDPLIRLDGRLGWLRHCLRFGPRNGDISCTDGILALRFPGAVRPRLDLEEPHRVAFPAGAPQSSHRGKATVFPNGSRDPFHIRRSDEAVRCAAG